MPIYYPGTTNPVTHSFSERRFTAEFDDALYDQAAWKNSRYDGSRLVAKEINKFTPSSSQDGWAGDSSYGTLPTILNNSTALYIANTVVGGKEDPQFASLAGHSYVNINKILLINPQDQTVQVIDRTTEPYEQFHRFITNDFPTGARAKVRVIDESIANNLKGSYRVKMNKGWLLKSFEYVWASDNIGLSQVAVVDTQVVCVDPASLIENNTMYLYRSGSIIDDFWVTGSENTDAVTSSFAPANQLRFRYGIIEMFNNPTSPGAGLGHRLGSDRIGPSFASSSILHNKFTEQYYSGSFGFITHNPITSTNNMADFLNTTGLGSASRFLGLDTLTFLTENNSDNTLTEQEKTELHITFFEGTKDFAPGQHDERSISTFEVDSNIASLGLEQGGECNGMLPTHHELLFKGPNDGRFIPTTRTHNDTIINAQIEATGSTFFVGACTPLSWPISASGFGGGDPDQELQTGVTIDKIEDMQVYVQGGELGEIGHVNVFSASSAGYGVSQLTNLHFDNFYSGSFNYNVSFLDKDHTLILNIDKNTELFEGIGEKGIVLIPENSTTTVSFNVEYYLKKAGIIDTTTDTLQNLSPDARGD